MTKKRYIIIGLVLFLGSFVLGTAPTVLGMIDAFNTLNAGNNIDEKALSEDVYRGLIFTLWASPFFLVGVLLVIFGIMKKSRHT